MSTVQGGLKKEGEPGAAILSNQASHLYRWVTTRAAARPRKPTSV